MERLLGLRDEGKELGLRTFGRRARRLRGVLGWFSVLTEVSVCNGAA